jgi:outer membrane protein assembly factor BamB
VGSLSGQVIAYDLADRTERWRYESAWNGSIAFNMAADAKAVYVPYFDGCLVVLDPATGRERWRTGQRFRGFLWPPAVSGERVFAADFGAGLFAFQR